MEKLNALKKTWIAGRAAAGYGIYVLFNVLFMVAALAIYVLTVPFPRARRSMVSFCLFRIVRLMLALLDLAGVAKFSTRGADRVLKGRSAVYVANHGSLIDSIFVVSQIPNSAVVVKSSYTPLLAIGVLVKLFDFVSVDKSSHESLKRAHDECRRLLGEGVSVIIFPEGTRNPSRRRLLEFGSLAFRLAAESKVPLVPAAIFQKGILLRKQEGSFLPPEKDSFILSFLQPIMPESAGDARSLSDAAYRGITRELASLKTEHTLT